MGQVVDYGVLAHLSSGDGVHLAKWIAALATTLAAACCDVKTRRIPNLLTAPMLPVGLVVAIAIGGWAGLWEAFAGMLLLGIPYVLLFIFAGGGAGDAKLMGVVGAWVGWHEGIPVLIAVAVGGGILAIGYALWKRRLGGVARHLRLMTFGLGVAAVQGQPLRETKDFMPAQGAMLPMPYGVAIFVGTVCAAGWVLLWH